MIPILFPLLLNLATCGCTDSVKEDEYLDKVLLSKTVQQYLIVVPVKVNDRSYRLVTMNVHFFRYLKGIDSSLTQDDYVRKVKSSVLHNTPIDITGKYLYQYEEYFNLVEGENALWAADSLKGKHHFLEKYFAKTNVESRYVFKHNIYRDDLIFLYEIMFRCRMLIFFSDSDVYVREL